MKAMMKQVYAEPAGSKVALPCRAAGAEPLHASWYTNGEKIDKSGRVGGYKVSHIVVVMDQLLTAQLLKNIDA